MFVWKQLEQLVKTTSSFSPRNCAAFSNTGFFRPHTKNKLFSTGLFPIFKCTPENYCDNLLHTSHIAICEVNGNKQKANPPQIQRQSNTTHLTLSQFKTWKCPTCPTRLTRPTSQRQSAKPQSSELQRLKSSPKQMEWTPDPSLWRRSIGGQGL